MTGDDTDMEQLDPFFDALKAQQPHPSDDLMVRVLADADVAQGAIMATGSAASGADRAASPGFWAALLAGLGGWPAAAGLVTAGVAGIWIGVNPPSILLQTSSVLLPSGAAEMVVDLDFEGGL